MRFLQSPLLTILNLIIGGRVRFFVWMATLGAALATTPFIVYGIRRPWLHLLELSAESAMMLGLQAVIGIGLAYAFEPWLEAGRQSADMATTAPARRRIEGERKPLTFDDTR